MIGLIFLFVIVTWFLLSKAIAARMSAAVRPMRAKRTVRVAGAFLIFVAPVADDIVGSIQFSYYCDAEVVKILGRIPVGPEFYSEKGEWLLGVNPWRTPDGGIDWYGYEKLARLAESKVVQDIWGSPAYSEMPGLLLIERRPTKIYAVADGNLLAEWNSYAYRGGILRRTVFPSTNACHPRGLGPSLYEKVFYSAGDALPNKALEREAPVGKIPAKCPATIVKASEFVPNPKLNLSPDEAVTAAETAHRIKCNSKLLQEVFADAENYYITRFGSSSIVVVDGQTGNVSVREAK